MDLTSHQSCGYASTSLIKLPLLVLFSILSLVAQASNGPSVKQLGESLDYTWDTLPKVSNCDLPSPQNLLCIQAHHGKTITVQLFGQSVNALILVETFTTPNVVGPVTTQQTGFLIGPFNGYGCKIIQEKISYEPRHKRRIIDNGLKVFAHRAAGNAIDIQGVELNKG